MVNVLVQKGNTILLRSPLEKKSTIQWKQDWKDRSEDYYVGFFSVPGSDHRHDSSCGFWDKVLGGEWPEANGAIFVQASKLDEFMKKNKGSSSDVRVEVDDSFQHGSCGENTRFLVFHDKSNKPYQHRFEGAFKLLYETLTRVVDQVGIPLLKNVLSMPGQLVGSYLRDF